MEDDDRRPILVCRLECPEDMKAQVDGWMPKHFDDSLVDPHVLSAANYEVIRDFRPVTEGGLPAAFNGPGNRFIYYVADTLEGYGEMLDSEIAREAIRDGADHESRYPPLDDEPFNGVMYAVREVRHAVSGARPHPGPIVVERFEVPSARAAEFDAWLDGRHLDTAVSLPGAMRVRTWMAHRDYPQRFPFERYRGKGNRMLMLELEATTDVRSTLGSSDTLTWLADSVPWDLRLPYVRREAATLILIRTKEDALAARAGSEHG